MICNAVLLGRAPHLSVSWKVCIICMFVCLFAYVFRKNLFIIYTPNNKINTFNHFESHVFDRWMKTD